MVQKSNSGKRSSTSFYRGDAGRKKAEEELARQKARQEARKEQQNQPFRFRVGVGDTTQFVVVDDAPDFYRFEHNLKNPATGYWDTFTGCIKEFDNCPVCEHAGRDSYYALYFTVIDLTEFTTKDGQKHEFSRKLLVVKPAQQKKFIRAFNKAEKEGRTLRGAIFEVTRDGEKDPSIGNDIELIDYMDEDELASYVRSWKDKDGKKHTEDCSEPYDYEEMFQEPDADQLRALVGAEPTPGSRAHERKHLGGSSRKGRGRDEDEDDDGEDGDGGRYERPERNERMRKSGASRRGRGADEDEDEAEDEQEDTSSRRSARSRREETSRSARGSSRRGRDEDEDDDGEEPEGASTRSRGRSSRASKDADEEERGTARRRGRGGDDDEEDERAPGVGRRVKPRAGRR